MFDDFHSQPGRLNGSRDPRQNAGPNGRASIGPTRNLTIALEFAEAGIPVLPVRIVLCEQTGKWEKKPLVKDWQNTATTDADQIEEWWRRFPNAAPGLALGRVGLMTIDADRHGGPDGVDAFQNLVSEHGRLQEHPITHTPGDGEHHVFKQPPGKPLGNGTGALPDGIDVRGRGGWIVAPGTTRPDGRLWLPDPKVPSLINAFRNGTIPELPDWLRNIICARRNLDRHAGHPSRNEHDAGRDAGQGGGNRERAYARAALDGCANELAAMQPHTGRNPKLNALAYRMGRMVACGWIAGSEVEHALWEACEQNCLIAHDGAKSVRATLMSGLSAGQDHPHECLDERAAVQNRMQAKAIVGTSDGPLPLTRTIPAADPFPVEEMGPVLGPAAQAIHGLTQAPIDLCANAVFGAAALAAQAHADIGLPSGEIKPISLHLLSIAGSGDRKTAADHYALRAIRNCEAELRTTYRVEKTAFEDALDAWTIQRQTILKKYKGDSEQCNERLGGLGPKPQAPLDPILTFNDVTLDGATKLLIGGQPSVGLFASEGGIVIGGRGFSPEERLRTAATLSELWDSGSYTRVRVGDGAIHINGRRLAVHLMAQPDVATMLLADPLLKDQGMLSRFLIAAPSSLQGTRFFAEPAPEHEANLRTFERHIEALYQHEFRLREGTRNELDPCVLNLSPDARRIWTVFHDDVERRMGPGGDLEPISGFAGKLPEHATRLAGVRTKVEEPGASEISVNTLESGTTMAGHYAETALRLHGVAQVRAELKDAEALLDWIKKHHDVGRVALPDIVQKGPNRIRDTGAARRLLKVLVDHRFLKPVPQGARVHGKHRQDVWCLS